MAATEPIRSKKDFRALAEYFLKKGELRNYCLVIMGAYTALRVSDLLRVTWADVYDEESGRFRSHLVVTEQKTGKQNVIALNKHILKALRLCYPRRRGLFLFCSNRRDGRPISRVQAWRIIHEATNRLHIQGRIGCHGLRKTWGYHAWTSGVAPVLIMNVYNHSSFFVTQRYLGITQDDLDRARLGVELM